ncbi:MAG: sensor histidine kinase [Chloroflexi bacterium]|nr:sensor histidine kinase [Chloroflexota bacterium]
MALPEGTQEQAEEQKVKGPETSPWDVLIEKAQTESEEVQRELKEIALMLDQSKVEVEKLAQRSATITMHLQQVQAKVETIPPADIRVAYDAALDAQQRLAVMRGQVEKLQSDQIHLERFMGLLDDLNGALGAGSKPDSHNGGGRFASAEMMIQAQEAERQRLSRKMHDGPAQALANFILLTEIAMRLFDHDQDKAREELSNLKIAAGTTFQKVRDFIFDLRPMMLDDLGLVPTIKRYVTAFGEKSEQDIGVTVTGTERRFESYLEVMIFRSVQELLTNAAQHSQGNQIKVQLNITETEVRASVEDDGKGFDSTIAAESSGLGLKLIRERVEMLGGNFEIDSAVGQGVRVNITIPTENTAPFA